MPGIWKRKKRDKLQVQFSLSRKKNTVHAVPEQGLLSDAIYQIERMHRSIHPPFINFRHCAKNMTRSIVVASMI